MIDHSQHAKTKPVWEGKLDLPGSGNMHDDIFAHPGRYAGLFSAVTFAVGSVFAIIAPHL